MKLMNKCQAIERFRIFHIFHPTLSEAGEAWPTPRRGLASEAKRIGTETKLGSWGLETKYYCWSPSRAQLQMNLELCCLAKILGRSWRKGTASRQASKLQGYGDCGRTRISQDEGKLEAGFKAIGKNGRNQGPVFGPKKVRKSRPVTWAFPVQDSSCRCGLC